MAKLLHENARPTGQRPRSIKEGVPSKHPIGAPFDGSRQVNCHRLLRGLGVDGFRDRDVSPLARLGIFIGGYAFQLRLASQVNGPIWF
jgi:hypothetical protein